MRLEVHVEDDGFVIDVPDNLIQEGTDFYARMDEDMDGGVQLGRQWVDEPPLQARCQIVADKLLNAVMRADEQASLMMAGYLLSRMPDLQAVRLDTSGELVGTEFIRGEAAGTP